MLVIVDGRNGVSNAMLVQLIQTPTENTGMPEHLWYPPLNLIWLANHLERMGHSTEILDGKCLGLHQILNRIRAKLIGLSFDIFGLNNLKSILAQAKRIGARTVLGGHLATATASACLQEYDDLDFVVRYDGEHSLETLCRWIDEGSFSLDEVPNLVYRSSEGIISNPVFFHDYRRDPIPKRNIGGLKLEDYFAHFQSTTSSSPLPFKASRPTNTYSHKGCPFRANNRGCVFCSRVDTKLRLNSPERTYDEYRYLSLNSNVDRIVDFSDSWAVPWFVDGLLRVYSRRGELGVPIRVYVDPRHINSDMASRLHDLGVQTVLLGLESGDEKVRKAAGKPISDRDLLDAVDSLSKANISIADAYVLGLPGESLSSVERTASLAKAIGERAQTEITYVNMMTPLPGSLAWTQLFGQDSDGSEIFTHSVEDLERLWIDRACDLGLDGYEVLSSFRLQLLNESSIGSAEFVSASAHSPSVSAVSIAKGREFYA